MAGGHLTVMERFELDIMQEKKKILLHSLLFQGSRACLRGDDASACSNRFV